MRHLTSITILMAVALLCIPTQATAAAGAPIDHHARDRAEINALLHDSRIGYRIDQTLSRLALNPMIARDEYHHLTETEKELFMRRLWAEYDHLSHAGTMHGFLTSIVGVSDRAATQMIDRVRDGGISVMNRVIAPFLKKWVISDAPTGDAAWAHTDAGQIVAVEDVPGELLPTDADARRDGLLDGRLSLLDQGLLRVVDGALAAGRGGKHAAISTYNAAGQAGSWLRNWTRWALGTPARKPTRHKKRAAGTW